MSYIDVAVGAGTQVSHRRCVFADYTGWLEDGTRFDTSREAMPGGPPAVPVSFVQGSGKVMRGWELGFEGMRVGGRRRLFIPYTLGYGVSGHPPVIPPRAPLVFDVEVRAVADATRGGECPTWSSVRP